MNKKIKNLLSSIAIFATISTSVLSYAAPGEICFGVNHPNILLSNGSVGSTALNTSGLTDFVHRKLCTAGYYNNYSYTNNRGSTIVNNMGGRAIFYEGSHGCAGGFSATWFNSSNSSYVQDFVVGSGTIDRNGYYQVAGYPSNNTGYFYSIKAANSGTTARLDFLKFAYFSSCYSANTNSELGNLINDVVDLGADSALGFTSTISTNQSAYFDQQFFNYGASTAIYRTIIDSAYLALQDTKYVYGTFNTGGVGSYKIAPVNYDSSVKKGQYLKIMPASYGS